MRILYFAPALLLASCADIADNPFTKIGYSIKTDFGTYRDSSLNGKADGELELDVDTDFDFRSRKR